MSSRQIPLTKARTELSRLARKNGLARGEVVEVTRRGRVALVVQRPEDYVRLRRRTKGAPRLWGSLVIVSDLEEASTAINARLRSASGVRRAR